MRHLQGESRQQSTLFPDTLDEYVGEDNPVRLIDAFVSSLDMTALEFTLANPKETGRKPYNPADLLKLYVYGYLNQVRSTRRLEKECHRNVEVLWLMQKLTPDFKTIANFRQQNSHGILRACQSFVQFCREASLLDSRLVAIDGSKFKAAASMSKTYNRSQLDKLQKRLNCKIQEYLSRLAESDQKEAEESSGSVSAALAKLQARAKKLEQLSENMDIKRAKQCCETEPEAKRMRSGRDGIVVGYNVQTAVEAESGLIVYHEVTDEGSDNRQLEPIAKATRAQLESESFTVLADAGYSNGEQLAQCEEQGIEVIVPANRAVNNQGDFYHKKDFLYDEKKDTYTCPAGQLLTYTTLQNKKKMYLYSRSGCHSCAQQSQCTKADKRWISRHFYEDALVRAQARVDANPRAMKRRGAIVERPFAHLKQIMGLRRFQCWGKEGAKAEMGIAVLSYNLNRMINQYGVPAIMKMI